MVSSARIDAADQERHDPAWRRAGEALLDRGAALRVLREATASSGWTVRMVLRAERVQERPGRRRTVVYRVLASRGPGMARGVTWFAKQYVSRKGARVRDLLLALGARSPADRVTSSFFRVPEPVGYHEPTRTLITARLEGLTLSRRLERGDRDLGSLADAVGRALACVHETLRPVEGLDPRAAVPTHGASDEAGIIDEAIRRVIAAPWRPRAIDRFASAALTAREALLRTCEAPERTRLLHRDLHPGQIVPGERVGLLDWDAAAWGEAELDLGNLEAHFILDDCRTGRAAADRLAPGLGRALRVGYVSQRGFDDRRRIAYVAATLIRLASLERLVGARRGVTSWEELAVALVDEAARHLEM